MAMPQNFALQKEKMKAKYLKHYFPNALLAFQYLLKSTDKNIFQSF